MSTAVILNAGSGAWAFEEIAASLSQAFGVPISQTPAALNYVLGWDATEPPAGQSFIPLEAVTIATDKRLTAQAFAQHNVPSPATYLLNSRSELTDFLAQHSGQRWLLKWPIGCGGSGHRFITTGDAMPDDWPLPLVVQEFIAMERPEVFRLYAVAGECFGWNARRFAGETHSPFVAHAQGARYENAGAAPKAAKEVAKAALAATHLLDSFGCVDLLRNQNGDWLALEVNTDGRWMHVDRDIALPSIKEELLARLTQAFTSWVKANTK